MRLPAYTDALSCWAASHAGLREQDALDDKLRSVSPELTQKIGQGLQGQGAAAIEAMLCVLLRELGQQLQPLATTHGFALPAVALQRGWSYRRGQHHLCADERSLLELWRFGLALEGPEILPERVVQAAERWLHQEIRGALRVAQRRSKSFGREPGLHRAGQEIFAQARQLESALSLALSDAQLCCSRASLADDWLQGVDLWLHAWGRSPCKGQGLAVSLARSGRVDERKRKQGDSWVWTPRSLSERLIEQMQCERGRVHAQAAWTGLGNPVGFDELAAQWRRELLAMVSARRGVHPVVVVDARVLEWLRKQRGGGASSA